MTAIDLWALNDKQRRAVLHDEGPLLVLAGAGSGKTRVIIYRIARLIADGVAPEAILGVTFTNKAAREMRQRLSHLIGAAANQVALMTFHALGLMILRKEHKAVGLANNFCIYDGQDQLSLVRELMRQTKVADRRLDAQRVLDILALTRRNGLDDVALDWGDDYELAAHALYPRYVAQMRAFSAVSFDDLIGQSLAALVQPDVKARWSKHFRYILVDEYQDTSADQLALLRHLSQPHFNICAVGDDDQAIYAWRGAGQDNILAFTTHFHNTCEVVLDENYRSTPTILSAANHVIAHNAKRKDKQLWSQRSRGVPIALLRHATGDDEAQWVADLLHQILFADGTLVDTAVLYRANQQSRALEEVLVAEKIPFIVLGGQALFDRKEARDAMALLAVLHNLNDEVALRRIINVPPRGLGPQTVDHLAQAALKSQTSLFEQLADHVERKVLLKAAQSGAQVLLSSLKDARSRLDGPSPQPLHEVCRNLFDTLGIKDAIARADDAPSLTTSRLLNLEAVLTSLQKHEEALTKKGQKPSLGSFLRATSLRTEAVDAPANSGHATLMTLHAAKGLEFKNVVIVGLEDGVLPHRRALDSTGPDAMTALGEERRLFYVGITRAKEALHLSYVSERRKHGRLVPVTPSRFLAELPDDKELVVRRDSGFENFHHDKDGLDADARNDKAAKAFFQRMRDHFIMNDDASAS